MTRDDPGAHTFDWVSAQKRCSLNVEFQALKELVSENCRTRVRQTPDGRPYSYTFIDRDEDNFEVKRECVLDKCVVAFALKDDRIVVGGSNIDPPWRMGLTLTLNDEGLCRFKIDGEGEYLRWQVARRALASLFFGGEAE